MAVAARSLATDLLPVPSVEGTRAQRSGVILTGAPRPRSPPLPSRFRLLAEVGRAGQTLPRARAASATGPALSVVWTPALGQACHCGLEKYMAC